MARLNITSLSESESSLVRSTCTLPSLASIVEELIFNALDAGATEIEVTVDVQARSIQVRDNGHGIRFPDLQLVGDRGATSRADPDCISFGFRGEALHALAAISLLDIVTRCAGPREGTSAVVLHLGHRVSTGPAREARSIGTTVSCMRNIQTRPPFRNRLI